MIWTNRALCPDRVHEQECDRQTPRVQPLRVLPASGAKKRLTIYPSTSIVLTTLLLPCPSSYAADVTP